MLQKLIQFQLNYLAQIFIIEPIRAWWTKNQYFLSIGRWKILF